MPILINNDKNDDNYNNYNNEDNNYRSKGTKDLINVSGEESSSGESGGKKANLFGWGLKLFYFGFQ